ncbi:putative virion structural protein [Vibrio phage pVa-21]|nr:putative virion structural protein [Vibrio phage pVa-21]
MAELHQNLLIDLDTLIDTRFGLIYQRFPKAFRKLDVYAFCTRDHNRIWELLGCDEKTWAAQWDKRDIATIESSKPTALLLNLKEIIVARYAQGKTSPVHHPMTISVNTYPYRLSKEALDEIKASVKHWTFSDIEVHTVHLAPAMLTPDAIKTNYQSLFIYDWVEWMTIHRDALQSCKIPTVTFHVPSYIYDNSPELMEAAMRSDTDPFAQMARYLSEYMAVEIVKPELFTLPTPLPS